MTLFALAGTAFATSAPSANAVSATVAANSSANAITLDITGGTADSVTIDTTASHGTASASGTTISYTPTEGYSGTDSFTYTATNGAGTSTPATVSITVTQPTLAISPSSGAFPFTRAGSPYSRTLSASLGTAPYTFEVIAGAFPPGVTLNQTTATLSGTPNATGTFNTTVKATDAYGATGTAAYSLTVICQSLSFTPQSGTYLHGTTGVPFSQSFSTSDGSSAAISGSGTPIDGLSFNEAARTYSGTPTRPDTQAITIDYTDWYGCPYSANYVVVISHPTITMTPAAGALSGAFTGVAYSKSISASGGSTPYTYTVASGSLPTGMTLDQTTGTITGTATTTGSASFTITAVDAYGASATEAYTLTVKYPTISLAPPTEILPGATAGTNYGKTISASGGTGPYTFAVTAGAPPPGTSLDGTTGEIRGAPTATGTYNFMVTATDSYGASGNSAYSVTVVLPTVSFTPTNNSTLPAATTGTAYSQSFTTSGTSASNLTVTGSLPPGLTFDSATNTLSGTPTQTGNYTFSTGFTDIYGGFYSASYSITVAFPTLTLTPSASALPGAFTGVAYNKTVSASGGSTPYTYAVTAGTLPSGMTFDGATGTISGTSTVTGNASFTITASDIYGASIAKTYTLAVAYPTITLNPTAGALQGGVTGVAYSKTIASSGGTAPYSYTVSTGTLPAGLTLNATTGKLSGTPTAAGNNSFKIKATDAHGASGTATYTLAITSPTIALTPVAGALTGGKTGVAYSRTISASGGTAPYSYVVSTGALPAGLTLNATTGKLTGTPTTVRSNSFTVKATDAHGAIGTAAYTLAITSPTITVKPAAGALPAGKTGVAYSQIIAASGGTSPYSFTVSAGALPAGLTLNRTTGKLTGTPTKSGSASFTIKVTDANGAAGTVAYTLAITAPTLTLTPVAGALPGGKTGVVYSRTIAASGGTSPYSYKVSTGTLPVGLTLNSTTGKLTGTPTTAGKTSFTIKATDAKGVTGTAAYTLAITFPAISLTPAAGALTGGKTGIAYNQTVAAAGGTSPYTYKVSLGTLPVGLTLSRSTGKLSGTPTTVGNSSFTIKATDAHGATSTAAYTLAVKFPAISLTPVAGALPAGKTGVAYRRTIAASGGTTPYVYKVSAGALPAGLTLDGATGRIAGTPTTAGNANFAIKATDKNGATGSVRYTIAIASPTIAVTPSVGALAGGKTGLAYSQSISASGGTSPYSYSVSAGKLPAGLSLSRTTGKLQGTPTATGNASITVKATDAHGATATASYTLNVVAGVRPPIAKVISTKVSANSSANEIPLKISGDAAHSVAIVTPATHGTARVSGIMMSYTPATGYSGPDSFAYTVTNAAGTSTAATVKITVSAPVFAFTPAPGALAEAMAGEDYRQQVTVKGGQAPLLYSITSGALPKGMVLNLSTGELTGPLDAKSQGKYTFTIRAKDRDGVTGTATYSLKVTPRKVTANDMVVDVPAGSTPADVYLNRGATGGPFTDAKLTSIVPANAGTAAIIRGKFAQAGAVEEPAGWYLQFTPNPAFSGEVKVGFQLTGALGASNTGTVTYRLAVGAEQVAEDIDTLVRDFVSTRQDLISSGIYVPGLLERRRMETATDSVTGRMTPSEDGMTATFGTSLAQLDAARDRADGVTGAQPRSFNAWINLAFLAHNREENGSKWGSFAMLNIGADYLLTEKALVGLSFHYDRMTDPTDADAELTGNGWLAGPNASLEIGKGVFWDTSLLYGGSSNNIDTAFWDGSFDTTRWMVDTAITGQWTLDQATVLTPKLRAVYFSENVDEYTVRNGAGDEITIEGFDEEQFRISLGAEIERSFTLANGSTLTPKLGATAGYSGLDGSGAFGNLTAGLALKTTDLWMFDFGLLFNIAEDGEKSLGGRASASRRF